MNPRPSVLITGATRGIGAACAHRLAPRWRVIVGGRDGDRVHELCSQLQADHGPQAAVPFVADLTDEAATGQAVTSLGLQHLDGLVHSAGVAGGVPTVESTRTIWREMLELNVIAVSDLTRLLLPALSAARGTVVALNSGAGLRASGRGGHYPASKFALTALTDVLREELRPDGVRVCSVHPGRVDTDMQRQLVAAEGRPYDPQEFLRPESVATAVQTALEATPEATFETIALRPAPR